MALESKTQLILQKRQDVVLHFLTQPPTLFHDASTSTSPKGIVLTFKSEQLIIAHELGTKPNEPSVGNMEDGKKGEALGGLAASPEEKESCFQGSRAYASHALFWTHRRSLPPQGHQVRPLPACLCTAFPLNGTPVLDQG